MGANTAHLVQALEPRDGESFNPSGGFRFFGGIVKQNLTWDNLLRVGGLLFALLTTGWQVTSAITEKLEGVEKRLGQQIQQINIEATERRVQMLEMNRRIEVLERQMEQRR